MVLVYRDPLPASLLKEDKRKSKRYNEKGLKREFWASSTRLLLLLILL